MQTITNTAALLFGEFISLHFQVSRFDCLSGNSVSIANGHVHIGAPGFLSYTGIVYVYRKSGTTYRCNRQILHPFHHADFPNSQVTTLVLTGALAQTSSYCGYSVSSTSTYTFVGCRKSIISVVSCCLPVF